MKKLFTFLSIISISTLLVVRANAGETYTAPQPPSEMFGNGWYWAIDLGANVYQDRGGDQTLTNGFGDTLTISPKNDVGFYGGVKIGYVFGTGAVRPVIEEDMFYNGFRGGADTTLNQL